MVFPHLAAVVIDRVHVQPASVLLEAHVRTLDADCPGCGQRSARVHSRYTRRLADAVIGARRMVLKLLALRGREDIPVRMGTRQPLLKIQPVYWIGHEGKALLAGEIDAPLPEEAWAEQGIDQAEFFLSANPGEDLRPLARIVSGGELSRVMLALKTMSVDDTTPKTMVFDEVDAGIGGRVADVVGGRLGELGARFQVLCITHLPQIAARASTHFHIDKAVRRDRTVTSVQRLDRAGHRVLRGPRHADARGRGGHDGRDHGADPGRHQALNSRHRGLERATPARRRALSCLRLYVTIGP